MNYCITEPVYLQEKLAVKNQILTFVHSFLHNTGLSTKELILLKII